MEIVIILVILAAGWFGWNHWKKANANITPQPGGSGGGGSTSDDDLKI